jgi:ABC-type multidrug transport system ATPase subunit
MAILSVDNISKNYGNIKALKGVSFSVPKGSVYGILGPNGSGKTTLLGIIMDVLKPTSGSFNLFNEKANDDHRKKIGTLLETPNFYHYLNAVQNLKISCAIKGISENDIEQVLHTVDLWKRKDSPFASYSLGMKQRLAIGAALLGNPEVLVFDEPTNGLDPVGISEIRTLIQSLSAQGKTIIMASHLLDEVEKVCTDVAILKQGTLIAAGSVKAIFQQNDIVQIATQNIENLLAIIKNIPNVISSVIQNEFIEISFTPGTANLAAVNKFCFENGHTLSHLQLKKSNLESKFLALTNDKK